MSAPTRGASRELDALVAEKVMGWRWRIPAEGPRAGWVTFKALLPPDAVDVRSVVASDDPRLPACVDDSRVPAYSTDITAAWLLVEKLGMSVVRSEDGWYAIVPEDIQHSTLRGTAYPTITLVYPEFKYHEPSATAPLAICRAALAAMEGAP